jgi:hypothetical protein
VLEILVLRVAGDDVSVVIFFDEFLLHGGKSWRFVFSELAVMT